MLETAGRQTQSSQTPAAPGVAVAPVAPADRGAQALNAQRSYIAGLVRAQDARPGPTPTGELAALPGAGDAAAADPAAQAAGGLPAPGPSGTAALPPEKRALLRQGSAGESVEYAQTRLNAHGASPELDVDGLFGPKTRKATVAYQSSHALVPDAVIGPKTWASLDGPPQVGKVEGGGGGAGGGGGPGAKTMLYDTAKTTVTPPADGTKKADMQKAVEARQAAGELGKTVKAEDGGDDALGAHLLNATAQLGQKVRWASEIDLQTKVGFTPKGGGPRPDGRVTLRLDGAGNADAKLVGKGKVTTPQTYTDLAKAKEGVKAAFGFSAVVDASATWTLEELNKVQAGLSRLGSGEKAALTGVQLVREATITGKDGKPLGGSFGYKHEVAQGATTATHEEKLSLANLAFAADDFNFVGGQADAGAASLEVIVHEAGHAVEHAAERKADAAKVDAVAAHNAAADKVGAADTAQQAAVKSARAQYIALPAATQRPGIAFVNASLALTHKWGTAATNDNTALHDANLKAARDSLAAREKARLALEKSHPGHDALTIFKDANAKVDAYGTAVEARVEAHKKQEKAKADSAAQTTAVAGGGTETKRLARFRAFVGKEKLTPPTQYAKDEGMGEWYAEAFALWKTDPEFLGDQYPKVRKWFDDGEHLKS